MAEKKKQPQKSKKNRKFYRNYIGRSKSNSTKYVVRAKLRGTFRERKSRRKKS